MITLSPPLRTALAALLLGGAMSGGAWAQGTWNAASSGECSVGVAGAATSTGGTISCNQGQIKATLSAWALTGNTASQSGWSSARLVDHETSGLGAYSGTSETSTNGHHAFDSIRSGCGSYGSTNSNCGGYAEAMLIKFTDAGNNLARLKLTQISTGWPSASGNYDADLSIYRWDGDASGPTMTSQVTNYQTGAMAGWTLVNSNDMAGGGDGVNPFNTSGAGSLGYSSYFLVTTYFGTTAMSTVAGENLDAGNDRFKIDSFTATNLCPTGQSLSSSANGAICTTTTTPPSGVPEPGSLALAGLALLGAFASRKKVLVRG